MVFDDSEPVFGESAFNVGDWLEFYPDAAEAIPHDAPMEHGSAVVTSGFVDADHAGCKVTRCLHTGVILFVNKALTLWYSKHQNTVETSTFGWKFCAMKLAINMIKGLHNKLWIMGILLIGPTSVFCDNELAVKNSTATESTLKKHHNDIAYHHAG
jgi:hypothetical protein